MMVRLVPCPSCGVHARPTETECPHCGASMRREDAAPRRSTAALLLGLTAVAGALATEACTMQAAYGVPTGSGDFATSSGTGGAGGEGGTGGQGGAGGAGGAGGVQDAGSD